MNVICTAVVDDKRQVKNLCDCVGILGVKAVVDGSTVFAEYEGSRNTAEKLVELFKQFDVHGTVTFE